MRVIAINSSLRKGGESRTELMLNHLVEGMREAGAEVEVVHLRQKNIKYCIGCFTCMTKTPGKCVHKDDMTNELFPKWLESDLVVYATPLFHHTVNAPMKTFIERTFPICEPFLEQDDSGRWVHPLRHKRPAVAVLSVCGFLEESAFEALSHYMNFLFHRSKPVAEIYRPASQPMTQPVYKDKLDDILDATRQAGRELVESMAISPQTMARIKQPIDDVRSIRATANIFWKSCIAEGVIPKTFEQRGMVPRPDSVETYMAIMSLGFNSQASADTKAALQFNFSGEVDGSCYFKIEKGTFEARLGTADNPDLTIKAPFEVWMDILTGKADGTQMLMDGKYQAEGDISLLMKMGQMFSRRSNTEAESQTEEDTMDKQGLTCRQIIAGMPTVFNAEAARDIVADIYYKVTGEEPGDYYLEIANGTCTFHEGTPASPRLTIETPSEVWVAISTGKLDGQQAFMEHKYKASGDFSLLMKLKSLFSAR